MPNDKNWQRRSDDWVKMTHESRIRKEAELREKYGEKSGEKSGKKEAQKKEGAKKK